MTISELKEFIYKESKLAYVLEQIGCHSVKYYSSKNYYTCGNYNGDNPSAVRIKNNPHLNVNNYTRTKEFDGSSDLIDLVQYNRAEGIYESLKYLHSILDIDFNLKSSKVIKKVDYLHVFKKVRRKRIVVNSNETEVINEDALSDYVPYIHVSWFHEGIIKKTIDAFQLAYSYRRQRNIIPVRHWLTGELIGITGRTMIDNAELFDIPKYFAIRPYSKSNNLYGLWENHSEIMKKNYIVVFEAEKSVLKRHSRLDGTGVAVGCHDISDEQVRIIIGLGVKEVVIAFDKDVDVNHIRHTCSKFYGIRTVSYMIDKWGLLNDKDSPADADNKIFKFMLKYRVRYDLIEHGKYLKSLEIKEV